MFKLLKGIQLQFLPLVNPLAQAAGTLFRPRNTIPMLASSDPEVLVPIQTLRNVSGA